MQYRKKLLVYVDADILGDALLKLPALPTLRAGFPQHEITWFSGRGKSLYRTLLNPLASSYIDNFIELDSFGDGWRQLTLNTPIQGSYDVIIDTQQSITTTLALKKIRHSRFISPAAGFLLSDNSPTSSLPYRGSVQERVLCLFKLAANSTETTPFYLNLPEEHSRLADALLPNKSNYIGVAPGAGGKNKIWPLENFIFVANEQTIKDRIPVFFLGPKERGWYTQIKKAVPSARFPEMENTAKQNNGPLLALALARRVKVALANDSGMGHVFNLANVALVSLFGPSNVEKFAVYRGERTVIRSNNYGSSSVAAIPVEDVVTAIDNLYER